jgi:catechol 2,3-dioxygenase-like lactoylglutathione lyase family enzyme
MQHLTHIALVVNDYDEAIKFYTEKLHFKIVEDTVLNETKRWVLISPPGSEGCCLLLAKAATEEQRSRIGNQTGGRVFLFLHTNNFQEDFNSLKENGVTIVRAPSKEEYGTVAVFADLYGNLWDLIEPSKWINDAASSA